MTDQEIQEVLDCCRCHECVADNLSCLVAEVRRLRAELADAWASSVAYAEGSNAERAAVVAYLKYHNFEWLADMLPRPKLAATNALSFAADDIEKGAHLGAKEDG